MKKLKLLYFDFNIPYLAKDVNHPVGGAAVEWNAWINGFLANGHKIGVLTFKGAKDFIGKPLDFDIVETYGLNAGIRKLRWLYKRFPALLKAVQQYKPDFLIQECAGYFTGIMAYIGKRLNIPFVYRVANDMDVDNRIKGRLSTLEQFFYKYGLKNANTIICQNTYQHEQIKKKFPYKKSAILHNPFYYDGRFPDIEERDKRKYIAWLGVFQYQKNMPALYKIVKAMPDMEFRIAGKPARLIDDKTQMAIRQLGQCKNVKFVGYLSRKEVFPFLSKAYVLLNTSHYEGFSNTFLESLFVGTPVVITDKVDTDSIISSNKLGGVVDNYDRIPDLINSLIIRGEDYDHIAKRCREHVIKHHDPKTLAKQFVEHIIN